MSDLKSFNVKVRAYNFSLDIIKFINKLPNNKVYWVISDQLIRSATSICANMIEAQASSSRKEFIKFYEISLKSCNECKYWISLIKDTAESKELVLKADHLLKETYEIGKMLGASILTLKGRRF